MHDAGTTMGCLLVVVGSSGAGKDSLIRGAQQYFQNHPHIRFAKRVITRPCNPEQEEHDSVSNHEFQQQLNNGEFAVHWHANDLFYGLKTDTLQWVKEGLCVIANGSRAALPTILTAYPCVYTIHITVQPAILAERLKRRGRETDEQIRARLKRNDSLEHLPGKVIEIDNSEARHESIDTFISIVEQKAKPTTL